MRLPLLVLLAWPIADLASLLLLADGFGALATLGYVLGTGALGLVLIRTAFRGVAVRQGARFVVSGPALLGGSRRALAGVLLLVPGLVSDGAALALLVTGLFGRGGGGGIRRPAGPDVVDLAPGEWQPGAGERGPAAEPKPEIKPEIKPASAADRASAPAPEPGPRLEGPPEKPHPGPPPGAARGA